MAKVHAMPLERTTLREVALIIFNLLFAFRGGYTVPHVFTGTRNNSGEMSVPTTESRNASAEQVK